MIKVTGPQGKVGITEYLYETLLVPHLSPESASLASALIYVFCLSFPMMWLYKKKIFIKL
jgi:hypothetical protein